MIFFILTIITALSLFICIEFNISETIHKVALRYVAIYIVIHFIIGLNNFYYIIPYGKDSLNIKYNNLNNNKNNEYLIKDIIEWNNSIDFGKKYCHDFWIGPYVPNIYDNLNRIEIQKNNKNILL